jgi:hypothetical protein
VLKANVDDTRCTLGVDFASVFEKSGAAAEGAGAERQFGNEEARTTELARLNHLFDSHAASRCGAPFNEEGAP